MTEYPAGDEKTYHIDYRYLRPKKAAWLKRMYDTPLERKEALSVWHGRNATILPLCARGGTICFLDEEA